MDPLYTVTVANLTRGWSYTHTHDPDGADVDPAAPVVLADDLLYQWGFPGDLIPSPILEPSQARVRLWCRDAPAVPPAYVGDQVTLDVRLGTAGPRIAAPPPMTVATVAAELEVAEVSPAEEYTAALTLGLVDDLAALSTVVPQPYRADSSGRYYYQRYWRPKLAEVAARLGRSIGCPTWWPDLTGPDYGWMIEPDPAQSDLTAGQRLERLLNTHQPGGYTHSLCPSHSAGYPAQVPAQCPGGYSTAYRWVGPDALTSPGPGGTIVDTWDPGPGQPIPDPATTGKFVLVPASRHVNAHTIATLSADWCDLPVKARRAREHIVDVVTVAGMERAVDASSGSGVGTIRPGTRTYGAPGLGAVARPVSTLIFLGDSPDSTYPPGVIMYPSSPTAQLAASRFTSDPSTRTGWVYDEFTIYGSRIPAEDQAAVLPFIAPRCPGEPDGDGHVLRRFAITGLDPAAQLPDAPVAGFMSSGQLRIVDGDLRFDLSLTPGDTL